MSDDNETQPCPKCGEIHEETRATVLFTEEAEAAGLSLDGGVVPPKVAAVPTIASALLAPLHSSIQGDAAALPYYAAALRALSRLALEDAARLVEDATEDLDEITPERFR